MNEWALVLDIDPVVKGRPRMTRWGRAYTPAKTAQAEKEIKDIVKDIWKLEPLAGSLRVKIRFICSRPKKPAKDYPRGDVDNYTKLVCDALNEIVWFDDSQIVDIRASKEYGEKGRVDIRVTELCQGPVSFE
jgi:Holliday junction resolvase RusA-like endonuclease